MGSNGIFVTLMVLQRDTNTFCFSSSPENINTDTTLSPQMSQPSESCWDRLLSKKGNRTLCLHFLKHHFTTAARPQNPCRLQPSVVCQTARNSLTNTLRSWDSCWRNFFTFWHVSSWTNIFLLQGCTWKLPINFERIPILLCSDTVCVLEKVL